MQVIAPTGTVKSTLIGRPVLAGAVAGRGAMFADPNRDAIADLPLAARAHPPADYEMGLRRYAAASVRGHGRRYVPGD